MAKAQVRRTQDRHFKTTRSMGALMLREMSTTYGKSWGGYFWILAEPIVGIMLMAIVFSLTFRSPPLGTNFHIFYATGVLPYTFYTEMSNKLSLTIRFSRQLISYPGVTYVDAILSRFTLTLLTQIMVFYIIICGILFTFETQTIVNIPMILVAIAMSAVLALGIGTMNCFLASMFPVWAQIWKILNRPLFILSCIFYTFESVPEPFRSILWYNPLVHITGQMRKAFYPTYEAAYISHGYVFGLGMVSLMFGLLFLRRYHKDILILWK